MLRNIILLAIASLLLNSCFVSHMQSAKLLTRGKVEATPKYSISKYSKMDYGTQSFGVNLGIGATEKAEIRFGYQRILPYYKSEYTSFDNGMNYYEIGPKISLKKDAVALYIPFSIMGSENSDEMTGEKVTPTLFITKDVNDKVELNIAVSYGLYLESIGKNELQDDISFGAGLGIKAFDGKVVFRPEINCLTSFEKESGLYMSYGIGTSFYPWAFKTGE